jgi:glutaredoxin 3
MFTIYTKSNCPNCETAKKLLQTQSKAYEEKSMDDLGVRELFVQQYPELRQMPQIFYGEVRLGGLAGLQAFLGSHFLFQPNGFGRA